MISTSKCKGKSHEAQSHSCSQSWNLKQIRDEDNLSSPGLKYLLLLQGPPQVRDASHSEMSPFAEKLFLLRSSLEMADLVSAAVASFPELLMSLKKAWSSAIIRPLLQTICLQCKKMYHCDWLIKNWMVNILAGDNRWSFQAERATQDESRCSSGHWRSQAYHTEER